MSIKLSPTHGVNHSVELCFYCRESVGVALLGRLPKDAEAPRNLILSLKPCETCEAKFKEGVLLIEVSKDRSKGVLEVDPGIWATGTYWLVSEEMFVLDSPIRKRRKGFILDTEVESFGLPK